MRPAGMCTDSCSDGTDRSAREIRSGSNVMAASGSYGSSRQYGW
jgi:hypothetical protein